MDDSLLIKAIITTSILLITTVIGILLYTKKQTKNTILLLGTSNAGKTAMYIWLKSGKKHPTVSSIKENEGQITVNKKTFELIDIPGHERVRYRYTDFLPVTRSIIFVIDSTSISRQIRPVAEYLYDILAKPIVQKQRIPILIACNKSDMITALPIEKIKTLLELEINRLRNTRTARVEQQEEDDEQEEFLGYEGEDFKLNHVDNRIDFESCSVENQDLANIKDWIFQ
ncbi:signal recognition particle receptor beta subunit-domain-containing protein [Cokeromyces recurvatus]|uniref:signal recognition particle receptor beta subunit-domain-containing protein n=1 Tax=Cokeromyces recurvatus TaxID=90255 RepID=UPI00221FAA34|nr:signal recognition particle receptor beta subunit-domain-containing protein [Cokeromyces recurvatus]KAI7898954.1 signal recognition particle receptor beta subunit-domain-containing protein [Cokeromyces recurvatus]